MVAALSSSSSSSSYSFASFDPDSVPEWARRWKGPPLTTTLYIPTVSVGAVIGRKGATIASIQKQAASSTTNSNTSSSNSVPVRVSVCSNEKLHQNGDPQQPHTPTSATLALGRSHPPEADAATLPTTATATATAGGNNSASVPFTYTPLDYSDPNWTPVVIKADLIASWKVASLIFEQINLTHLPLLLDIPVSRQRHASIVGKRGLTLMQLSADSHCRIWIPPKDLPWDVVQLEGTMTECWACLEGLANVLNNQYFSNANHSSSPNSPTAGGTAPVSSPNNNNNNNNNNGNNPIKSNKITMTCSVNPLPSQTKLKSIGRKTSTLIKKRKTSNSGNTNNNNNNSMEWSLTIVGNSQTQVQQAHDLLILAAANQKTTEGEDPVTSSSSPPNPSPRKSTSRGGGSTGRGNHRAGGAGAGTGGNGRGGRGGRGRTLFHSNSSTVSSNE